MRITNLRCEYQAEPLCIDASNPRLSWQAESDRRTDHQAYYQVQVASAAEALGLRRHDDRIIWDTGKINDPYLPAVHYGGPPLRSGTRYYWAVRAWDRDYHATNWSMPSWFETGLLEPRQWHGCWIGRREGSESAPAPLLRHEFILTKTAATARAYICGLGYYELRLNGARIGDHLLDPAFTNYEQRVLYTAYDITPMLLPGVNVVSVILGNGWYNQVTPDEWRFHEAPWRGAPRTLCELRITFSDRTSQVVASGPDWQCSDGPIIFNSVRSGETYDARLEQPGWDAPGFAAAGWEPARELPAPRGSLVSQSLPPIKVMEKLQPVTWSHPRPDVWVADLGQTIAGTARLRVRGPAGTRIVMRYAEILDHDGLADQKGLDQFIKGPFQTDTYILRGDGEECWNARFTYHGFRYVECSGLTEAPNEQTLTGLVLYTSFERAGEFSCSNEILNRIQDMVLRSYRGNFHGYPTDCPQREKNGWTADAWLVADTGLCNYDTVTSYMKWLDDCRDCQAPDGNIPAIAPTPGWGGERCDPCWGSAYPLLAELVYNLTGDVEFLVRHYEPIKRYIAYLGRHAKGYIIDSGLGDWDEPGTNMPQLTPIALTATAY
ncbi:MAG: family 78 glycoside hydrolase catalytic domain, partial [Anaerolineae bacterium]